MRNRHATEPAIDDSTQALHGVVRRTVVDDDQLEVAVGLREHTVDGFEDESRPVEGGNDHRKLRLRSQRRWNDGRDVDRRQTPPPAAREHRPREGRADQQGEGHQQAGEELRRGWDVTCPNHFD